MVRLGPASNMARRSTTSTYQGDFEERLLMAGQARLFLQNFWFSKREKIKKGDRVPPVTLKID